MKILYLGLNIRYPNPILHQLLTLLKRISKVDAYGPGYTAESILEQGVFSYYKKNGPYDLVFTTTSLFSNDYSYLKNGTYVFRFNNIYSKIENLKEMKIFFEEVDNKKVVYLQSDLYHETKERMEYLKQLNAYIYSIAGEQFYFKKDELKYAKYEKFYNRINENYSKFLNDYREKIISLFFHIDESEFYFDNPIDRKYTICVPGEKYYLRRKVLEILKNTNFKKCKYYHPRFYWLMWKMGFKPHSHYVLLQLYQLLFKDILEKTKYIYTDGSAILLPIRKFFEIPANGAVLFATAFKNAKEAGFIDGETYVECSYENIIEKIEWLESDSKEALKIAKSGQEMIWELHSTNARVKHLKEAFDKILSGNYKGSYWKNGKFCLR